MNSLKIVNMTYSDRPGLFQDIKNREGSTCFTTPSQNQFCYTKPRMYGTGGVSGVVGSNGVDGELHFNSVDKGTFYFTIKNITRINNDEAMITFADKDYQIGNENSTSYQVNDKFEYSTIIKKFDTFVANCNNGNGTDVTVVQYVGIRTIDGVDYFVTWHTPAHSEKAIECKYPEIIQYSLKHHFGDL